MGWEELVDSYVLETLTRIYTIIKEDEYWVGSYSAVGDPTCDFTHVCTHKDLQFVKDRCEEEERN